MKPVLGTSQIQRPILAPSMQQSIEMLMLPMAEVHTAIETELQNNPLLEAEETLLPAWQQQFEKAIERGIQYYRDEDSSGSYGYDADAYTSEERPLIKHVSLQEHLTRQLHCEISDPHESKLGEFIIGNLDEDGYLRMGPDEIIRQSGNSDVAMIERVLGVIQRFEPLGVASRDLKECLLTQVRFKIDDKDNLVSTVISDYLDELGRKKFAEIAKKLQVSLDRIREISQVIASLEPKPARGYQPSAENIYIKPDVTVFLNDEHQYEVIVHQENIPRLRINPIYQKLLKEGNRSDEEINFIREKIKNALLFMRSIEQRYNTIRNISEFLVKRQRGFLEEGCFKLKPMTLKDVASAVERNESTISRAISNKYIDTPHGLYPFKYFFSQAVQEGDENGASSRSIKEEIRSFIETENTEKPFSDQDIYQYLSDKGYRISRRTINKYRQTLKILPSHLRKV